MTDNSNAEPERIWALPDLTQEWAKDGGLGDRPYDHLIDGYTEYVRRAEVDALLKAERAKAYERAAVEISDYQAFTKYAQEPLTNEMCAAIRALAKEDE